MLNFNDLPRCSGTNRQGQPCGQVAMGNGKCRFHGGKSTGSPKGSRNALKTGAYVSVLNEAEQLRFMAMQEQLGKLDSELNLLRWRLEQVLVQKKKWEEDHPEGDALEAVEAIQTTSPAGLMEGMELEHFQETDAGRFPGKTVTLRKPDWDGLILRFEAAISRSEERRSKLLMNDELKDAVERLNNLEEKMKGQEDGKEEGSPTEAI